MEDSKYKIACIVVTFNRKNLLKNCLDALAQQSYKPVHVYIVDNASTDATCESIESWGYMNNDVDGVDFEYLLLPSNQGGAGGFYAGMKKAHETGLYDGIWVMDDDGVPDVDCLKNLVAQLGHYNYIAPRVIDVNDHSKLAFNFNGSFEIADEDSNSINGIIENRACPMNGILFSASLISKIGYPVKEMFIWGDETNYTARCIKAGMNPVTVASAIHFHPKDRNEVYTNFLGSFIYVNQKWKAYCLYRNFAYNVKQGLVGSSKLGFCKYMVQNLLYILLFRANLSMAFVFCKATSDGLRGKWGGHFNYMKP